MGNTKSVYVALGTHSEKEREYNDFYSTPSKIVHTLFTDGGGGTRS